MAWAKNENLKAMHDMYMLGFSLTEVGNFYGKTRQSIFGIFKYNNLPIREKKLLGYVTFNGNKYTLRNHGYFVKTDGVRSLMHRDVWEFHNGQIPRGWDVHHKDEDKQNNALINLECLPKAEHTRLYSPHNNQYTKGRKVVQCGA